MSIEGILIKLQLDDCMKACGMEYGFELLRDRF